MEGEKEEEIKLINREGICHLSLNLSSATCFPILSLPFLAGTFSGSFSWIFSRDLFVGRPV